MREGAGGLAVLSRGAALNVMVCVFTASRATGDVVQQRVRVQTVDVWGKLGQRTAYAAANLSTAAGGDAEQPPIFLSLLVPVNNRSKTAPLCKAASERAERGLQS